MQSIPLFNCIIPMEINQIQKGNYVHIQPAGSLEICQVIGVHEQVIVASINDPFENLHFDPTDIIPIPLTALWIKELGFEEVTGASNTFGHNGVTVKGLEKDVFEVSKNGDSDTAAVTYVHELQNYYTGITGEAVSLP
jgi:hypothetical protein